MHLPAPLAVPVEVRALDSGPRNERVWRESRAIGEEGLRLGSDLPFEAGRPVSCELRLPGDPASLVLAGRVVGVAPDDPRSEGEAARPRVVAFTQLDEAARTRVATYVLERTLLP